VTLFLQKIVHVGPIRPRPERTYVIRDTDQPRFEREGLRGWYNFLRDRLERADQADLIDEWMRRLDLASEVRAIADKDNKPVVRSQVLVNDKVECVNIKDIGFGASQVLPVIIAVVSASSGSLIIIEQPELHLHTSIQIELMDIFIELTKDNLYFLIETHSEHMLLRLQRRIAETFLESNIRYNIRQSTYDHSQKIVQNKSFYIKSDMAIILFSKTSSTNGFSNLESILLRNDGHVSEASNEFQDFFQQDYDEVNKLIDIWAQLKKLKVQ